MIGPKDMARDLTMAASAVERATEYLLKRSEADAILHFTDQVNYSPLATELANAYERIQRVRIALETNV